VAWSSRKSRMEAPQPELQNRRAHRRGEVHRLRALLHRLLGWRTPVHLSRPRFQARSMGGWSCTRSQPQLKRQPRQHHSHADSEADAHAGASNGRNATPLARIRASTRRNVWAAICARCLSSRTASPWSKSRPARSRRHGRSGRRRETARYRKGTHDSIENRSCSRSVSQCR